ncbi:VOC family protein [Micromonospora sp. ATCC 39149]|uniref:VOC family protein n=1 Tax=Micromonospora carbonacea TaxID=47853 RepID=A0A7D5Y6S6_9ACTN|nr:VOC family protein [Micromonospora sp. ATCC 39149]QLK00059.1 VOC family protein [Micromonospora carbonacea]
MAVIAQVSLGVSDCERAGRFWAAALGYVRRPPRYPGDDWIVLAPPPGVPGTALAMDLSESPVEPYPRVHLDLNAGGRDLEDEVERLVGLGARRVDWPHYPARLEPGASPYVVLADTEGNRFCVSGRSRTR